MRWPWVSREMHLAVIAGKNEVIHTQQRQIASLEEQLKNPAPVNVKVEMPGPPPISLRRRANKPIDEKKQLPPIDWENVDPNDNHALARIAAQELGPGYSPYILSQTIDRIKFTIRQARKLKARRLMEEGRVGITPEASTPEYDDGAQDAPEYIRALVDSAERG